MTELDKLVGDLERCPHCAAAVDVYARSCPSCGRQLVSDKLAAFDKLHDARAISDAVYEQMRRLVIEADVAAAEPAISSATSTPRRRWI